MNGLAEKKGDKKRTNEASDLLSQRQYPRKAVSQHCELQKFALVALHLVNQYTHVCQYVQGGQILSPVHLADWLHR